MVQVEGCELRVKAPGGEERHVFPTPEEAKGRAAFIAEALSWVGTPFRDCADIKGRDGAVDCAMLLVRSAVDTGRIPPFDPRPYSPRWMLHKTEEKFIDWLVRLGAHEVERPQVGDIVLWQFAKTFAHGAVLVNSQEVVHAYASARMALVSRRDESLLMFLPFSGCNVPRPVKYFDLWSDAPPRHPGARSEPGTQGTGRDVSAANRDAESSPLGPASSLRSARDDEDGGSA